MSEDLDGPDQVPQPRPSSAQSKSSQARPQTATDQPSFIPYNHPQAPKLRDLVGPEWKERLMQLSFTDTSHMSDWEKDAFSRVEVRPMLEYVRNSLVGVAQVWHERMVGTLEKMTLSAVFGDVDLGRRRELFEEFEL